jgi:hypothetical protein
MAHQWWPTYPKLERHYMGDLYVAKMKLFNARTDVEYYELQVFDSDWSKIPFASKSKVVQVSAHATKSVNIYVRGLDLDRVTYICSQSKTKKEDAEATVVSSRICSRVK